MVKSLPTQSNISPDNKSVTAPVQLNEAVLLRLDLLITTIPLSLADKYQQVIIRFNHTHCFAMDMIMKLNHIFHVRRLPVVKPSRGWPF